MLALDLLLQRLKILEFNFILELTNEKKKINEITNLCFQTKTPFVFLPGEWYMKSYLYDKYSSALMFGCADEVKTSKY